ncbi:MAG: non-canonical purine NTP pyrophosphatase, RdgB/HAM1 family [Firmicutes bacterium HGW-Firmicutes-11]|jgi:XTP/dITP diphosphohydrolase|nr:MAG: non-canonical purine NTP pyrophosphatase, RdgB/HAM1 family [Firmicutes bacterium HGW-Firmicutes-11]
MNMIAATQNPHKIKEIDAITKSFGLTVIGRSDAGVAEFDIIEDGTTFEENSLIKAMAIHKETGAVTIADDSGIEVDELNGMPGIHSARFAGEDGNDKRNNQKLLRLLEGVPRERRTGRFVSVITVVFSEDDILVARGECEGHILHEERGAGGFGYDPLFVPDGYDKSFGEMGVGVKNQISHRARALQELSRQLQLRGR